MSISWCSFINPMFYCIHSAPADVSTEDAAAAHATGNGVTSEVGSVHASVMVLTCLVAICAAAVLLLLSFWKHRLTDQTNLGCQATGEGAGEDVDSDSDSDDDDDDDVRVTIGDIKTGAPQYT